MNVYDTTTGRFRAQTTEEQLLRELELITDQEEQLTRALSFLSHQLYELDRLLRDME